MNKTVIQPSVEMVQKYISRFDNDQELTVVEDVLSELFGNILTTKNYATY